jgi:indolepyruvate ferredoxin oxidoreductase
VPLPTVQLPLRMVQAATRAEALVTIDAEALAAGLFGDHMPANMLVVGAAFQHGCLPLSAAAIERAIELNGAAVEVNLTAFRWGRAAVADPASVETALARPSSVRALDGRSAAILDASGASGELLRLLEIRVPELVAYQDEAYARRYVEDVTSVAAIERERTAGSESRVAEAYARGLFKLMAYKDEYEVARLHLDAAERARREDELGAGAKVRILLHPPLLRAMGLRRKLRLGPWVLPFLRALVRLRRLRGTHLDPFGSARVRRVERELIEEYRALVAQALERLDGETAQRVAEIAALPDLVRGYEEIKLRNVERFRERAKQLALT